ncbi:SDR family oxidoreductase [Streptomyces sp. NPDC002911]
MRSCLQAEGRSASDVSAESVASIPVGRYGAPADYADTVAFLASPRAGYITGSLICRRSQSMRYFCRKLLTRACAIWLAKPPK